MIVAVVGMCGAGKSTVADILKERGFSFLRLGQLTLDILKRSGMEINEKNERKIREDLRKKHGMAAFIRLNLSKIEHMIHKGDVVLDGLYSWEEFLELKKKYHDDFVCLAVVASPDVRYERLKNRSLDAADQELRNRPFSRDEAISRDHSEIENINKAGPIAMADYTILNERTIGELKENVMLFLGSLS